MKKILILVACFIYVTPANSTAGWLSDKITEYKLRIAEKRAEYAKKKYEKTKALATYKLQEQRQIESTKEVAEPFVLQERVTTRSTSLAPLSMKSGSATKPAPILKQQMPQQQQATQSLMDDEPYAVIGRKREKLYLNQDQDQDQDSSKIKEEIKEIQQMEEEEVTVFLEQRDLSNAVKNSLVTKCYEEVMHLSKQLKRNPHDKYLKWRIEKLRQRCEYESKKYKRR